MNSVFKIVEAIVTVSAVTFGVAYAWDWYKYGAAGAGGWFRRKSSRLKLGSTSDAFGHGIKKKKKYKALSTLK